MPQTSHHVWTEQELHLLGLGLRKYAYDWKKIASEFLPHLNAISVKNKFYKRPVEIINVINELGLKKDKIQAKEPTLGDLQQIKNRLEKELADIKNKIQQKLKLEEKQIVQSPQIQPPEINTSQLLIQQTLSLPQKVPSFSQSKINFPEQQVINHSSNQSIDWGKPIIGEEDEKNKGLVSLLDNYSQQFAGYLNPICSFEDQIKSNK